MRKMFLMLASVAVLAISCAKQGDDPKPENSIIGEWSGLREGDELTESADVFMHFNFKADGTYEQIMPAWGEKDCGKYTVSGDLISFELTSLEWLWDNSANGYDNVYDQYGCYWNPDKYDENRTKYPDPFAQFCKVFPGRAYGTATFSFDKDGHLLLEAKEGEIAGFGLQLIYHKNPGYKPEKPQWL